jgi:signal transduction histidine kinase
VAHEINNPVHFIQGNLDFLEQSISAMSEELKTLPRRPDSKLDAQVEEDLASILSGIREGVARTVRIVADLRTFSRLDRAEVIEIDLCEALEATLNLLRARLRPVEVVREFGEIPLVSCFGGQVNQVFMNLIVNAIDALGEGGRICIRTGHLPEKGRVFVEVEDNGCGMDADVVKHIFDPFFTTKEVGKGTGLGLSVSHGIIERHGGTIDVTSHVGMGSTFRVELPLQVQ